MPNPILKSLTQAADAEEARALRAQADAPVSVSPLLRQSAEDSGVRTSTTELPPDPGFEDEGASVLFRSERGQGFRREGARVLASRRDIEGRPAIQIGLARAEGFGADRRSYGRGLGVPAYLEGLNQAAREGVDFASDGTLSIHSTRVWEGLERRGVPVERNREAMRTPDGAWVAPEGSWVFRIRKEHVAPALAMIGAGGAAALGLAPDEAEASPIGARVNRMMPALREWASTLRPVTQRETGSRVYSFDVGGRPAQVLLDFDSRGSATVNWGWTDQSGIFAYRDDLSPREIVETWGKVWAIVERDSQIRGRREYQFTGLEERQARTQAGILEEVTPPQGYRVFKLQSESMGEPVFVIRRNNEAPPKAREFALPEDDTHVTRIEKKPEGGMVAPTATALALFAGGALGLGGDPASAAEITSDPEEIARAAREGRRVELLPDGGARISDAAPVPPPAPPPARRARESWEEISAFQGVTFAPRARPRYDNIVAEQWEASLDQFTLVYADNARQRAWAHGFDEQDRAIRALTGETPPDPYPPMSPIAGRVGSQLIGAMIDLSYSLPGNRGRADKPLAPEADVAARTEARRAWLAERGLLERFPIDGALEIGLARISDTERRMIEVASVPSTGSGQAAIRLGATVGAGFAGQFQDPFQAGTLAIPVGGGTTRLLSAARAAAETAAIAAGTEFTLQQDAQALREEAGLERENIAHLVALAAGIGGVLGGGLGAAAFRPRGGAPAGAPAPDPVQAVDDAITGLRGLKDRGLLNPEGERALDALEAHQAAMTTAPEGQTRAHLDALRAAQQAAEAEPVSPSPTRSRLSDDDFDDPFGEGAKAQAEELARELETRADLEAEAVTARAAAPPPEPAPEAPARVRLPSGEERAVADLFLPDGSFDSAAALSRSALKALDALERDVMTLKGREALRAPERLSDWVVRQGGVQDLGGDIAHAAGEAASEVRRPRVQGKFAKAGRVVENESGVPIDDLALRAWEDGWFPHLDSRPHLNELIEALADDLNDTTPYYRVEDAEDVARMGRLADLDRELDERGVDLRADRRTLRAQLAEAFDLIPEGFVPPSRAGDDLGDFADMVPVEVADASGRVRYDLAPADDAFARAERDQFMVERFKDCVT